MLVFLYHTWIGRLVLKTLCQPSISRLAGRFLDSKASLFLIKPFVRKNHIDLADFETDFHCFNDCFSRKIKPGLRPFSASDEDLCSPCDGLLSVYRISDQTVLPVKQSRYTISSLLRDPKLADQFTDGICMVFRLCVNHYHRYAYFDDCTKGENIRIPGVLHTVRPIALERYPVFTQNSREYTVMDSKHFKRAVQIEVGAMLVGKISNRHGAGCFRRGEEKGCFLYGGSTIILLLEKGVVNLRSDLVSATGTGAEIPVKMGEVLAKASDQNGQRVRI